MEPLLRDPEKSPSMDELQLLIISMDDELSGYRWREAIWLSILAHVVVFLAVWTAPYWLPTNVFLTAVLKPNRDNTTFMVMPSDLTHAPKPPKTDIISDKNRMAQSRTPVPDREALRRLNVQRPGAPTPETPPPGQPQQQAQQQPAGGGTTQPPEQQPPPPQTAQIQAPPQARGPSPFKIGMAPGSAIEESVQSIAAGHGTSHVSFGGGDYGASRPDARTDVRGDVDILSDTMGVDFGPYLQRVIFAVRTHWYNLIPESARPPIMKKGKLTIDFAILKDGRMAGLQTVATSGDDALDRAARGGITDSNPFPPLPAEFRGQFLQLRFKFFYNPSTGEIE
ncbi:MAG TPA: TonB C-terminal domain-containing protein [Candidatus Saccharimonadales bacterium]|jgi:TonB family protein|nr:TonB C-terminal domain-containing protein [Candidatus Saccharimonadales bacterium]